MRCTACNNGLVRVPRSSPADPDVAPCSRCTGGIIAPDFEVFVPGRPRPQGSKSRGKNGHMYEASKYVKAWRQTIVAVSMPVLLDVDEDERSRLRPPLEGPLALGVEFLFKRPKDHYQACLGCRGRRRVKLGPLSVPSEHAADGYDRCGYCKGEGRQFRSNAPVYFTGAPDLDKLHRAIQDSLEAAGVCRNDSQFVKYHEPVKRYANPGEQPGAWIRVWRIE